MRQFFSLLLLCFLGNAVSLQAQSDTYQIEDLTSPRAILQETPPDKIYANVKNVTLIKHSLTTPLAMTTQHPVLGGYLKAYQDHRPVTISPDIMWLLISQGFAQHVNNNAEKLRSMFVDFEGQETLVVRRNVTEINLADFPWEGVFPEFAQQIGSYTGHDLINTLTCNFSTSTPTSSVASQITVMEAMKNYFEYKVFMIGCGLPSVTIEGTIEDWEKILEKLDFIEKYDLKWWTSELKPVIEKIIETKSGKLDKEFWMDMVRFHREGIYGSLNDIDGWLVKFYPYSTVGTRMNLKKIESLGNIPSELVRVPFILEIQSSSGDVAYSEKMEFWAGFMGMRQDAKTFNLKPEIGWAINRLGE